LPPIVTDEFSIFNLSGFRLMRGFFPEYLCRQF
jgi:hypothetical protein